jgi:hypothetical protein
VFFWRRWLRRLLRDWSKKKGQDGARVQGERRGTNHGRRYHLDAPKSALHTVSICEGRRGILRQPGGVEEGNQRGNGEEEWGFL